MPIETNLYLCLFLLLSLIHISNLILAMQQHFHTNPADLLAAIGPHIGPCCFEVDPPVGTAFAEAFPKADCVLPGKKPGKQQLDLTRASAYQLYLSLIHI